VPAQPIDNPRMRLRPGGLAQHVGIDKVRHSVLVDSDEMGTK
jgi:hypothetical protein